MNHKQALQIAQEERRRFINTISKPPARRCSGCGEAYYRINKLSQWTGRNPGKCLGWHREEVKLCTKCCSTQDSLRLVDMVEIKYSKKIIVRRKV